MNIIVPMLLCLTVSGSVAFAAGTCVDCHGNAAAMKAAGYPDLFVSPDEVMAQIRMPAVCTDCHLGDASSRDREGAHRGLLAVRAVRKKDLEAVSRGDMPQEDQAGWGNLEPRGSRQATRLLPKRMKGGRVSENPEYRGVILHDKNPGTLAFNPETAMKTCGRCHGDKVKGFLRSPMGGAVGAHTQSQYRAWTGPAGPQSCGLWVGALSLPDQGSFTAVNVGYFNEHSTMPLRNETAFTLQRNCNQCHAGCLDCHADIRKKDGTAGSGVHTFTKAPSPYACYGGGRSFSCHAGPLERRRGDGYIRGEFTQASAEGVDVLAARPDVHYQKGITCTQCHEPNVERGGHADLRRNVQCGACHKEVAEAHARGPHRRVDCASCHTALIGGYAFNFWSATGPQGQQNPITRIQDYQTSAVPPLIVRNPAGMWIPVHVVPHTSGNVKAGEVTPSRRLLFRNPPDAAVNRRYPSNDSYAITGLARAVDDSDHDVMAWLNLDRVAHATGKARVCSDCHAAPAQRIRVAFSGGSYKDVGDGSYEIIADSRGLRVTSFRGPGGGPAAGGLGPFQDKWGLGGDFSLPAIRDHERFRALEKRYREGSFVH